MFCLEFDELLCNEYNKMNGGSVLVLTPRTRQKMERNSRLEGRLEKREVEERKDKDVVKALSA